MTLIPGLWKLSAAGLVLVAVLFFGWKANQWRNEAAAAGLLKVQIQAERDLRKKAEQDALLLSAQLRDAEGAFHVEIREIVKKVPIVVNRSPDCGLGTDALSLLNRARGYGLPSPASPNPP